MKLGLKFSVCLVITAILLAGCSLSNENTTINNNTNIIDNNHNSNNSSNKPTDNNSVNTDKIEKNIVDVLEKIKDVSKEGKVINCDIVVGKSIYDDAVAKWGDGDTLESVEAAKGMYATYSKENIVLGMNKGEAIFEVRSFDESIKNISLSDVENFYGNPEYNITTASGEKIVGYTINNDYKIEFVFDKSTGDSSSIKVDHYLILYPKGTVNLMADDPGRQW